MTDIVHVRLRRFHALHDLLTGAARKKLPRQHHLSSHLAQDIGISAPRVPHSVHVAPGALLNGFFAADGPPVM